MIIRWSRSLLEYTGGHYRFPAVLENFPPLPRQESTWYQTLHFNFPPLSPSLPAAMIHKWIIHSFASLVLSHGCIWSFSECASKIKMSNSPWLLSRISYTFSPRSMARISNKIDPNLQYSEACRESEGEKERLLALWKTDGGEHGTGKGPIETNLTSHVFTRNPLKTHFIQGVIFKK